MNEQKTKQTFLASILCEGHIHLIIGSNVLASARCRRSLQTGARPILIAPDPETNLPEGLASGIEDGSIRWLKRTFHKDDLKTLGRADVDNYVDAVFITTPGEDAAYISSLCKRLRIPINVTDSPELSTFTPLSTYTSGPLQVGVTTSGNGCALAARIRREITAFLPQNLGQAVQRLGDVRRTIKEYDNVRFLGEEGEEFGQSADFNKLLRDEQEVAKTRRARWLAQVCEYWPLSRLAEVTDEDVNALLEDYKSKPLVNGGGQVKGKGRIILAGAGPGHPDLLTVATLKAIRNADLILADKLVPAPVLELVPRRTPVRIARKFPGNADAAQEELHRIGLEAMEEGKTVVRLKQGDPYLYGRGAEEVDFFRGHGYEATVLPGITSSLSAPLFAKIPATHRCVSDQIVICTGTGRKGASPEPPFFRPNQTVVFLMALHRLRNLVASLTSEGGYPRSTQCAIIERASCPDQRVIRTTLEHVDAAFEEAGSRPPGLLVVGAVCGVLAAASPKWSIDDGFRLDDIYMWG
ncbi:uroporphyrin-III C-methyltransferase [Piedraia hortae CBS 480.64]|uniref:Uroporphyrin-III C-methyltransferase n=1 Tax=Piedraia hortae CBS 480.64 TaxID=1314780 RepID=A0A6A7C205_9PEZI|nr:uroporphyrin-III C-methyltransferase [Piedraia hortae CBS 480.64]